MEFGKDLRLARDLVRRYVKAYSEIMLEHRKGSDVWECLSVNHLFSSRPG